MKRCQKGGAGAGGAAGAAGASAGAAPSVSAAASVSWAARAKEAVATGDVYRESSPTSPTHPHPLAGKRPSSTDPTSHACTPERILAGFCRHSSSVGLLTHGSTYKQLH